MLWKTNKQTNKQTKTAKLLPPGCCSVSIQVTCPAAATCSFQILFPDRAHLSLYRRLGCAFQGTRPIFRQGSHEGSHVAVPGESQAKLAWTRTGLREAGAAQVAEEAASSGGGSWGGQDRGARGCSWWPRAEEAAPPFPEAAPSTPPGSAPGASPSVGDSGARSTGQIRPPALPFPWLAAPPHISTGAGQSPHEKEEKLLASVSGSAGFLPVWQDHRMGRKQGPGGVAGLCHVPWSLPRTSCSGSSYPVPFPGQPSLPPILPRTGLVVVRNPPP